MAKVRGVQAGAFHASHVSDGVRGFTLLELLVVLAITAILSATVVLSLPSAQQRALEQEGLRVSTWLEAARARSRASGEPVVVQVQERRLVFQGAGTERSLARAELSQPEVVLQAPAHVLLGPEPILPAQSLTLHAPHGRSLVIASDGVQAFAALAPQSP